jgi:hypothetical protein
MTFLHKFTTKFNIQQRAYILSEARDKGLIRGGVITRVIIDVGGDGGISPVVFYALENNSVMNPPGGFWREYQLVTEEQARDEAIAYHNAKSLFHKDYRDNLS